MGKLEAIWLKRARGGPMDPVDEAFAVEGRGLEGGADFGRDRQVTLIEREVFERLKAELDDSVEPMMRRANLMVSGIRLEDTRDRTLAVGDLRITSVVRPVPADAWTRRARASWTPSIPTGAPGPMGALRTTRPSQSVTRSAGRNSGKPLVPRL